MPETVTVVARIRAKPGQEARVRELLLSPLWHPRAPGTGSLSITICTNRPSGVATSSFTRIGPALRPWRRI